MSDGEERKDELKNGEQPAGEARPAEGAPSDGGPSKGTLSEEGSSEAASAKEADAEPTPDSKGASTADDAAAEAAASTNVEETAQTKAETVASAGDQPARPAGAGQRQARKPARAASKPAGGSVSKGAMLVAIGLIVGATGGWAAREARAHTLLQGGAGDGASSCATWESRICESLGAEAFTCLEAKTAAGLLPAAACDEALDAMPDTLQKAKEARKSCDELVSKLCADLGHETQTCEMVREKSQSFPPDRCQGMLDNYEQVAGQLRMMEQAQRSRGPGMAPGGPHGASPHGGPAARPPGAAAPPGAAPPGAAAPGTPSASH